MANPAKRQLGATDQMDTDAGSPVPGDSYVQSFARGLQVIRSFSAQAPQQTLTEVAARSGLSRAGARRILLTLQTLGYVSSDGRLFKLTPRILDLGFAYLSSMPMWNLAEPEMQALAARVGESCSAAMLDGADIVYVLRVPTHKIMSISLGVGSRLPAHCTSLGRMLLAGLSDDEALSLLHASDRPALKGAASSRAWRTPPSRACSPSWVPPSRAFWLPMLKSRRRAPLRVMGRP
jgi:IclR family pca regulon transcriptional regulator